MRRKSGWLAAVFGGLLAQSAVAAAPPAVNAPPPGPLTIIPAPGATSAPPTIVLQGPVTIMPTPAPAPAKKHRLGSRLGFDTLAGRVNEHRCEPDGCPTPIGCSNVWTEFRFVFGSCTQFFGSADATRGMHRKTVVPPPNP